MSSQDMMTTKAWSIFALNSFSEFKTLCRMFVRTMPWLAMLLSSATASSPVLAAPVVTATPWCDNSLRMQVRPAALPAVQQDTADALSRRLLATHGSDWPWLTHTWPRNPPYVIKQIFFGGKKKERIMTLWVFDEMK